MAKEYAVYMMASRPKGALYIGMSGRPQLRVAQQKGERGGGAAWALKYKTRLLVHVEFFEDYAEARAREMKLKKWDRKVKEALIEKGNPEWRDLAGFLGGHLEE